MAFAPVHARTLKDVLMTTSMVLGLRYGDYSADGAAAISGDLKNRLIQLANDAVVEAQDIVVENLGFNVLMEHRTIYIAPPLLDNQVTVTPTVGSKLVAVSDMTPLGLSDIGRYIKLNDRWFKIMALDVPGKTVELECAYGGAAGADTLKVYTIFHPLSTSGARPARLVSKSAYLVGSGGLTYKKYIPTDSFEESLKSIGTPTQMSPVHVNGELCLFLYPVPSSAGNVQTGVIVQPRTLSTDSDTPDLSVEFHRLWETVTTRLAVLELAPSNEGLQKTILQREGHVRRGLGIMKDHDSSWFDCWQPESELPESFDHPEVKS